MKISKRATDTTSFIVMDILERAEQLQREGHPVIHLEVGQPDFPTPQPIIDASIRALQSGKTAYTHSLGLIELREAIAEHYYNKYQVNVSPDQVIVTPGSSPAMLILFQTILEENDQFILSNPYYSCYPNFIRGTGADVVLIEVYEDQGFQLEINKVKSAITHKTKGIMINSPGNPTGTVYSHERLNGLANLDLPYIVSDEIYHGLNYGNHKEHTILEYCENGIVINGFSKTYAMTGWRLGYLIVPQELVRPIHKLLQNYFISANNFVQWGGIAALKECDEFVLTMRETYNKRRFYMINQLREMGFSIIREPEGAFYIFVNAKHLNPNSKQLAWDILENCYVGVDPGIDFGSQGEGFLRFSYANSLENIEIALDRLRPYLNNYSIHK